MKTIIIINSNTNIFKYSNIKLKKIAKKILCFEKKILKKKTESNTVILAIHFVNKKTIIDLNKKFLNRNSITDVITFNFDEERLEGFFLGEIYICSEQLLIQAKEAKHSPKKESILLVIHGILHLLGYDHLLPGKKGKIMISKQMKYFQKALKW